MIEGKFDSRTLAAMNAALDKVCALLPDGEVHIVRKRAAKEIVRCASSGQIALDELIVAGKRGLSSHKAGPAPLDQPSRRLASR